MDQAIGTTQMLDLLAAIRRRAYQAVVLTEADLSKLRALDMEVRPVRPALPALAVSAPILR